MRALNADLINNIVEVSILFFCNKWLLALAAFRTSLGEPLGDAILVKDLLAIATLDGTVRDTKADWADERVDETSI